MKKDKLTAGVILGGIALIAIGLIVVDNISGSNSNEQNLVDLNETTDNLWSDVEKNFDLSSTVDEAEANKPDIIGGGAINKDIAKAPTVDGTGNGAGTAQTADSAGTENSAGTTGTGKGTDTAQISDGSDAGNSVGGAGTGNGIDTAQTADGTGSGNSAVGIGTAESADAGNNAGSTDTAQTAGAENSADSTSTVQTADDTDAAEAMTSAVENLLFNEADGLSWPVNGDIIMKFSKDHGIYHQTLCQFKTNPAVIINAKVGDEVIAAADGIVTSIVETANTGKTITLSIGNGYELVYGQLEADDIKIGELITEGEVIGVVAEPTKYYSVEGPNIYFQVMLDGEPTNPENLLMKQND